MLSTLVRHAAAAVRPRTAGRRAFSKLVTGRERVFVVGVGMTKFEKPGRRDDFDYPAMVKEAGTMALHDADIEYDLIEQVSAGYVYGDSTCGNRAAYELGLTGVPIFNTNNNCSTGSTALMMAREFVAGGMSDCVMALGFEKMQTGSLPIGESDRENPLGRHMQRMADLVGGFEKAPPAPWLFACAGRYYMNKYNVQAITFAKIAEKNHRHSADNPFAQFQDVYTLDEVMASKPICDPLTMLQCSPTSDGAGAAILASEEFVRAHGLEDKAVEIVAQAMTTDNEASFDNPANLVGFDMARRAANKVYEASGLTPSDVDVIELHDCFSANELLTYEALGLCAEGGAEELVLDGNVTHGGKWVVNPSGGLISKGHPLGATGLAQCAELTWQLRGDADNRQVPNARVALQHNLGLGGACVVTMYRRADL